MPFASRTDLVARANIRRIAQLAAPADMDMVPVDMLRIAIDGGDLSGYPSEDQNAITIALDTIDKCLSDADALLMTYDIPETAQSTLLARLASTVALYYLQQGEQMTDAVQAAYDGVIDLLDKHAKGQIDLTPVAEDGTDDREGLVVLDSRKPRYGYRRKDDQSCSDH